MTPDGGEPIKISDASSASFFYYTLAGFLYKLTPETRVSTGKGGFYIVFSLSVSSSELDSLFYLTLLLSNLIFVGSSFLSSILRLMNSLMDSC